MSIRPAVAILAIAGVVGFEAYRHHVQFDPHPPQKPGTTHVQAPPKPNPDREMIWADSLIPGCTPAKLDAEHKQSLDQLALQAQHTGEGPCKGYHVMMSREAVRKLVNTIAITNRANHTLRSHPTMETADAAATTALGQLGSENPGIDGMATKQPDLHMRPVPPGCKDVPHTDRFGNVKSISRECIGPRADTNSMPFESQAPQP